MNILFENSYIRNKDLAKEMYGYIFFRRNYLFVAYIVLLISFIINLQEKNQQLLNFYLSNNFKASFTCPSIVKEVFTCVHKRHVHNNYLQN